MKRFACVVIHHPDDEKLILHGRRNDCGKWTLPGGSIENNESPKRAALRELMEEAGIKAYEAAFWGTKDFKDGKVKVSLYKVKCPKDLHLKVMQDPDKELNAFKFLDPLKHGNLYVPLEQNILKDYLDG